MCTVGYGDVLPKNDHEIILIIFTMLFAWYLNNFDKIYMLIHYLGKIIKKIFTLYFNLVAYLHILSIP